MATCTIKRPEPVVQPPIEVHLNLSFEEATFLQAVLQFGCACDGDELRYEARPPTGTARKALNAIEEALRFAGAQERGQRYLGLIKQPLLLKPGANL